MNEESEVPGLKSLRRAVMPQGDLWPGIQAQLKPRRAPRAYAPWAGMALAASLLLMFVLPLRVPSGPALGSVAPQARAAQPVMTVAQQTRFVSSQLKLVQGAEAELLYALKQQPQSPALRRLLESTRQRQRDLRRLMTTHV